MDILDLIGFSEGEERRGEGKRGEWSWGKGEGLYNGKDMEGKGGEMARKGEEIRFIVGLDEGMVWGLWWMFRRGRWGCGI